MAGNVVLFDVIRDSTGSGVNGAAVEVRKLSDNSLIASTTTATIGGVDGAFSFDETTFGYPGPYYYSVTDPVSGVVRKHTSKSTGQIGPWRGADMPLALRGFGDGVIDNVGNELVVSASGASMTVSVATGAALGYGMLYTWPEARSVTITANSSGNPRIDNVVLRFYPPGVSEEGRIDLLAVAGTPAGSPVAPTPTQNTATYWEVVLATVRVETGAATIAADKVTDARTYALSDARLDAVETSLAAKQPLDADLTALAGLTSAADKGIQFTGPGAAATYDLTTAGKALLDDADAAAQRATLGLGNVDNTSDASKPVSTATQTALNLKQDIATVAELIRDTIGTALVAGSNVTLTVNDAGDTITIAASTPTLTVTVQEGDVTTDAVVTTIDFDASDFNVSSSPAGEANVSLNYGASADTPAAGDHVHSYERAIMREVHAQRDVVASGSATISSTTGADIAGLSDTMVFASGLTYDIVIVGAAMLSAGSGGTVSVAIDISGTNIAWTPDYIGVTTEGGERSVMPTCRLTGIDGVGQTITVTMKGKRVTSNGTVGSASFQGWAMPREVS